MKTSLLGSLDHYCFHSPVCNIHQHPDLHHCHQQYCPGAIQPAMAKQVGLMDEEGEVRCPICEGPTTLRTGDRKAEVHVKLCTDETIHYPEMHKAGKITTEKYQAWKSTLTRNELLGHYKRVPDAHVTANFTHDETALMQSDLPAFNALLQQRLKDRAENALLHMVQHRHETVQHVLTDLPQQG